MEEDVCCGCLGAGNTEMGAGSKNIETFRQVSRQSLGNLGIGGDYGKQETAR